MFPKPPHQPSQLPGWKTVPGRLWGVKRAARSRREPSSRREQAQPNNSPGLDELQTIFQAKVRGEDPDLLLFGRRNAVSCAGLLCGLTPQGTEMLLGGKKTPWGKECFPLPNGQKRCQEQQRLSGNQRSTNGSGRRNPPRGTCPRVSRGAGAVAAGAQGLRVPLEVPSEVLCPQLQPPAAVRADEPAARGLEPRGAQGAGSLRAALQPPGLQLLHPRRSR